MNYQRVERIRRAAILIASLEPTLADQMLANLPPAEAAKVAAELERLDDLDPEEQQDVLEEFRRAGRTAPTRSEAVEFTYSAPRPVLAQPDRPAEPAAPQAAAEQGLEVEAALIAELLADEHPQTIAAALSRLEPEQASAAFAALPAALQADVLDRLAQLQLVDEDAVRELETQLKQRIDEQRARRKRMAASIELARRMLARTAPEQREALMARISPPATSAENRSANGGADLPRDETAARADGGGVAQRLQALRRGLDFRLDDDGAVEIMQLEPAAQTDVARPAASAADEPLEWDDQSDELEQLSDEQLLAALQRADEATVQRALAASSEAFLDRVAARLPRRHAARLRRLVRGIGPTRLAELRTAQRELLRLARTGSPWAAAS